MTFSVPSFLAAVTKASIPPMSAADLALAALAELVLVPPQAVNRVRAPARMPRWRRPPPPKKSRRRGLVYSTFPSLQVDPIIAPFNHLSGRLSRKGRLRLCAHEPARRANVSRTARCPSTPFAVIDSPIPWGDSDRAKTIQAQHSRSSRTSSVSDPARPRVGAKLTRSPPGMVVDPVTYSPTLRHAFSRSRLSAAVRLQTRSLSGTVSK